MELRQLICTSGFQNNEGARVAQQVSFSLRLEFIQLNDSEISQGQTKTNLGNVV